MNDLISRNDLLDAMPKDDMLYSFDVRRVICNMPAAGSHWISVEDSLPDDDEKVLVFARAGDAKCYDITEQYHGSWNKYETCVALEVTHWMPLPTLPKEEN